MAKDEFTTYCLGNGAIAKCDTCQRQANWDTLNQMPEALRKEMQSKMTHVRDTRCQLIKGQPNYIPIESAQSTGNT